MTSSGTSDGSHDTDLIGLISSFLGPSPSYSRGDGSKSSAPSAPPSGFLASTPGEADIAATEANACLEHESTILPTRVLIFSKDRPWQLQQLLRSMKLRRNNSHDNFLLGNFQIYIILRASSPEFSMGYQKVIHEYDGIHFLIEDDNVEEKSFSSLLEHALTVDTCPNVDNGNIMFLTDDCLLLEPLEGIIACALGALRHGDMHSSNLSRGERVFNFLSRLHPGISWCQTRGVASPPPRDEMKYHSLTQYLSKLYEGEDHTTTKHLHDGVYLYNRKRCSGEWAYHFCLSGGIYFHSDVLALLKCMKTEEKSHPNLLEMRVNQLLKVTGENATLNERLDQSQKSLSAIPTRPFLLILAVNRVQDVFQAPLALPREGNKECIPKKDAMTFARNDKLTVDPGDPLSLLTLIEEECHLDCEKYKSTIYNTSHIGDFFIKQSNKNWHVESNSLSKVESSESASTRPKVSVLIPVHCGPPGAASHSIISVIMQPIEEFHLLCKRDGLSLEEGYHKEKLLSPIQIVLVEDRCDDGSIDAMISSCHDLVKLHTYVHFMLQDHRCQGVSEQRDLSAGDQHISILLDIVRSPRHGIACALNHGLSYCHADLIARMDADDVSTPQRLLSQIRFMRANPSFAAIGTSTVLFSAKHVASGKQGNKCSNLILPYDNLIQKTESCCILRPSLSISDPGFMAWAMFFTCSISHPSVVFQKNTIQELGGYDELSSHCVEDYDLWLRLLNQNSRSIACLPFLGLWHRKHKQSSSSVGATTQKDQADRACYRALKRLFNFTNNDDGPLIFQDCKTLRNPSLAQSSKSLDLAAKLLHRLESSFLEKNSVHLSQQEIVLIQLDCNARIGELATILVTKFGNREKTPLDRTGDAGTSFAWKLWRERCPDKELERLSLLCHMNMTKISERK